MSETIEVADRLALHELATHYSDLIDAKDWPGLAEVFTEDAVFDIASGHTRS
ncbi:MULTISPECIES: nuclear transport factor 2 family protein [Rhodococcus]|uniref:nuclear transport factor 2 family protein n=1 Tax=Rhodococcus TaxID=1827 RepID=UPI000315A62B|nr:nuclear transport factor 2 family protein [Rhodococcus jostii]